MDVTANSSTSNCNAVPGTREDGTMGSAVIQMEVDLMEVQKQWEESQDHSTGNGGASMETSGVPSEGMVVFLTFLRFLFTIWSLQHFTQNRIPWRLMAYAWSNLLFPQARRRGNHTTRLLTSMHWLNLWTYRPLPRAGRWVNLFLLSDPKSLLTLSQGIIARQQGLSGSFRIFIDFEITTPQFGLIKNWSKRLGR